MRDFSLRLRSEIVSEPIFAFSTFFGQILSAGSDFWLLSLRRNGLPGPLLKSDQSRKSQVGANPFADWNLRRVRFSGFDFFCLFATKFPIESFHAWWIFKIALRGAYSIHAWKSRTKKTGTRSGSDFRMAFRSDTCSSDDEATLWIFDVVPFEISNCDKFLNVTR